MTNKVLLKIASVAGIAVAMSTAHAQTTEGSAEQNVDPAASELTEVVVTGSRLSRRDFVSASPIVTATVETLQESGKVSVEAALNQMPQFLVAQGDRSNQQSGGGRASLNLRGLGENRNLVLLDGRRLPVSSAFGVVDVNLIAPIMLESVETISGGASAVYGSDAISGVVNFKSLRGFEGVRVESQYGWTDNGGGATTDISMAMGSKFGDGRGSSLLTIAYSDREEIRGSQRDFLEFGGRSGLIGQGTYVPGANQPSQAAIDAVFSQYGVAPGTVLRGHTLGFNDNGTLFDQTPAINYQGPTQGRYTTQGNSVWMPIDYDKTVGVPMTRWNIFGKLDYALTEAAELYGQFLYSNNSANNDYGGTVTAVQPAPTIPVTNPFIPADLATLLASRANPTAPFTLNKRFMSLGFRNWDSEFDVAQVIVGLRGDLPVGNWKYDVYASHDTTNIAETANNAIIVSRLQAVLNDPQGGAGLCAGGFNPFGLAGSETVSQACRDYMVSQVVSRYDLEQNIVEANVRGTLLQLPADDMQMSFTVSHRTNEAEYIPGAEYEYNEVLGTPGSVRTRGETRVTDFAVEILAPLLRDKPFAESLNLNAGARYSDYDVTGGATTYKAELDWRPVQSLLLRGGYEKAIRAPNIGELYSAEMGAQGSVGLPPTAGDPCDIRSNARLNPATAADVRALCLSTGVGAGVIDTYTYNLPTSVPAVSSGNLNLDPEEADTTTFGVVWNSPFSNELFSNFTLSVDYYDIDIKDIISTISVTNIVNKCYNRDGSNPSYSASNIYCTFVQRAATGEFSRVSLPYLNLGKLGTSGIDLQFDWKFGLGAVGLDDSMGEIFFNTVINHTRTYEIQIFEDSPVQDFAGTVNAGAPPEYRAFTRLGYRRGPLDLSVRWQWISSMDDQTAVTSPTSVLRGVPSYSLFDLNGSYTINDTWTVHAGVANLTDKIPPVVAENRTSVGIGNFLYDLVGRSFRVGLRASF